MWLLNTQSQRLEKRDERDENLEYAILSHTWLRRSEGEGEGVLFADMSDLAVARQKAGWNKLNFAITQAAKDGLQYVWVDTCCINKESSAELAEAINSMLRFYMKSKVCYVYLDAHLREGYEWMATPTPGGTNGFSAPAVPSHDALILSMRRRRASVLSACRHDHQRQVNSAHVPISEACLHLSSAEIELQHAQSVTNENDPKAAPVSICSITAFLSKCRWFKRGWTLQEMIASPRILFFNATGRYIGALADLVDKASIVTGVHRDILSRRRPLSSFGVAQRMAWAANRETTRIEDRAYSMLGIFDISLPIIYGEGERAFRRLQEELLRVYDDHTIFAWDFRSPHARHADGSWVPSEVRKDLLAPPPDAFKDDTYARLTAVTREDDQKQYELLGRTIRFHLPVFDVAQDEAFQAQRTYSAVLNCCFEDNPINYIVLHLVCEASGDFTRTSVGSCDAYQAASRCTKQSITILRQANDTNQGLSGEAWRSTADFENLWIRCFNKDKIKLRPSTMPHWNLSVISGHGEVVMNPEWTNDPLHLLSIDSRTWDESARMFRLPASVLSPTYERKAQRASDTPYYCVGHLKIQLAGVHSADVVIDVRSYPRQLPDGHFVFDKASLITLNLRSGGRRSESFSDAYIFPLRRGKVLVAEVHTRKLLSQDFWLIEFRQFGRGHIPWLYFRKYCLNVLSC